MNLSKLHWRHKNFQGGYEMNLLPTPAKMFVLDFENGFENETQNQNQRCENHEPEINRIIGLR